MVNFSNILKTVPDTPNGNIIAEDTIKKIRSGMMHVLKTVARKETGNVFLIAPSGTTDKLDPLS
jgi:hypothetical protein